MAGTDPSLTVVDAGPIIHLDELGCLDLLGDFAALLVPREVWHEVARHRSRLTPDDIPGTGDCIVDVAGTLSPRLRALIDSFRLDAGETAALALMEARRAQLLLCDDAAARLAAESLGFPVHGTIGVLVRSIRRGLRSRAQVLETVRRLPDVSTLHISRELLATVIAAIEHDPS
jgi:predicted nucleic acid-binding protein